MVDIRVLGSEQFSRIMEIDRSEHVTERYRHLNGRLIIEAVSVDVPRWSWHGHGPHTIAHKASAWLPILEQGGVLLGAFAGEMLAGLAVYRPFLTAGMGQLAALYVDRSHRGRGIGRALFQTVVSLAHDDGAGSLYVSSTPTRKTVDFYVKCGCHVADPPHPELLALEPDDIHLLLDIQAPPPNRPPS